MPKAKKVIFVIVEGPTDEDALSSVLKALFSSAEVHFHVIHGDITAERSICGKNARSYVGARIDAEMKKYAYRKDDVLQIVHLIDTDGAFIPDELVRAMDESETEDRIRYYEDHIVAKDVCSVQKRNRRKSEAVAALCATGTMKAGMPYSIYYFSRNMEHVLHGIADDLTDDRKVELADAFAERYENDPEGFVQLMNSADVAVPGTYGQTWNFIRKGANSLQRHSNLCVLLEQENLRVL